MNRDEFEAILHRQDRVFTRTQVLDLGASESLIRRMIRRREWVVVHPGVMIDHTGALTGRQREWAAVLHYAPAALTGHSALRAAGVRTGRDGVERDGGDQPIEIAVDRCRRVEPLAGVKVTRMTDLEGRALAHTSPPRVRLEHVVLDLAAAATNDTGAVAILADACQSRRTTARRLLDALAGRQRIRRRPLIERVLHDVAAGATSALEWLYLTRVERPHLPGARRQRRIVQRGRTGYRDVEYPAWGVVVELDGRLGHTRARDRWDDLERDVDTAVSGLLTLRLGWRQVVEPCRTAAAVAQILRTRGWRGALSACAEPGCHQVAATLHTTSGWLT
jgi:hypothetical protein